MVTIYKVSWDRLAKLQLKEAYLYIKKDSFQNAEKVKKDILSKAATLSKNPQRCAADKFRIDKDTNFRAFEIHRYRITYYINESAKEVMILRIRNAKQEPLEY